MDLNPLEREKSNSCMPIAFADGQVDVKITTSLGPTTAPPAEADLPPWSAHTHFLSGQPYFCCESTPRIITTSDISNAETMKRIACSVKRLHERFTHEKTSLSDTVVLFLQLGNSGESQSCAYYLVDHGNRTMFWIDPFDPEVLGLPPVTSTYHLKSLLEVCYWIHVQHFPMQARGTTLHTAVEGLISVFSHARDDHTASKDSFPFVADECNKLIDILETSRDYISEDRMSYFAARLWSIIASHKAITYLGQEPAQEDLSKQPAGCLAEIRGLRVPISNVLSVTSQTVATPSTFIRHSTLVLSEMQRLVDAMYEISLSGDPFLHCELMIKITTNTGIIPTKSHLHDVVQISPHPQNMTAGANISTGVHKGNAVALKKPRHYTHKEGTGAVPGDIYREYYIASMFDHPHVMSVLGIFVDPHDSLPAMVSLYMCYGTMCTYLEGNPNADRLHLLSDVASGLAYIHSLPDPVVHRDVRGANIVVNAEGKAVLIDFGSSMLLKSGPANVSSLQDELPGTPRWMAPEALSPGHYPITQKVDVWAFACLGIEVFSGQRPFNHIVRDAAVLIEVLVNNGRPPRPQDVVFARQLNDPLWGLMEQSWELDPSDRPSMANIHLFLSSSFAQAVKSA